jgi:putative endonuclease
MPTAKSLRSKQAYRTGLSREALAALILRAKFYRVLGTRLRTPFGEVDILAEKNGTLVVVEVKARSNAEGAAGAISSVQKQRLLRAAEYLGARQKKNFSTLRCDAFLFSPGAFPRHIKNAFEQG